jgi:sugar phosphate isomerase/epimerase
MQAAGISATEISLTPEMYPILDHKQVEAYAKKYGVELWSYHLPFHPFTELDPSSLDGEIRKHTLEYFTELIKKGSDIGIDKFIVHPSGERIYDEERADRMKYSMESMDKLAEIAYQHGAWIAIEDLPRTCLGNTADEVLQLISVNDKLRVCFDTNHLLKDDQIQFMDKLADKIITVHISDYDYVNERHWLPGEGKIDWNAFIERWEKHIEACNSQDKPRLMTEFGAGAIPGVNTFEAQRWTEDYQADYLEFSLNQLLEHEDMAGTYIWQYCDIRIPLGRELSRPRSFNNKGIVDEYRRPKRAYRVVQEIYGKYYGKDAHYDKARINNYGLPKWK